MSAKISVVLPVYNGENYLREALDSVFAQTEADFELIVGDDGSTDRTSEILTKFADPRLKVFRATKNRGQFGNLNWLLTKTRSALIKFLCHDDILTPECLAEHVKFFTEHPDASMSMCQATMLNEKGEVLGSWPSGGQPVVYEKFLGLQLFLYYGSIPGNLSSVCVRRVAFDETGTFDESFRLAGDFDMWVRICSKGCIGDLQKLLFWERHHGSRETHSHKAGVTFIRENRRIRHTLLPLVPKRVRSYAQRYIYFRQNVLDTHQFVTCVRQGCLDDARELIRIMGTDLLVGFPAWLLTVNNHLYRPAPRFTYSDHAREV